MPSEDGYNRLQQATTQDDSGQWGGSARAGVPLAPCISQKAQEEHRFSTAAQLFPQPFLPVLAVAVADRYARRDTFIPVHTCIVKKHSLSGAESRPLTSARAQKAQSCAKGLEREGFFSGKISGARMAAVCFWPVLATTWRSDLPPVGYSTTKYYSDRQSHECGVVLKVQRAESVPM